MACCKNVGHHVDRPDLVPLVVGGFGAPFETDSCIGAEKIDRPHVALDFVDQRNEASLVGDVDRCGKTANRRCHPLSTRTIEIDADHAPRTLGGEALSQGLADSARSARDHHYFIFDLH